MLCSDGWTQRGTLEFDCAEKTAYALLLATNSLLPYSLSTAQLGERNQIESEVRLISDLLLCGLLRRTM